MLGDLAMSKRHVQGAVQMVELNGGPQTLGLNGFLEMVLYKYVDEVGLLAGVQHTQGRSADSMLCFKEQDSLKS